VRHPCLSSGIAILVRASSDGPPSPIRAREASPPRIGSRFPLYGLTSGLQSIFTYVIHDEWGLAMLDGQLGNILEVAIGLTLVFAVLSTLGSTIAEFIARLLALRSSNLAKGMESLLGSDTATAVYNHRLVSGLSRPSRFGGLLSRIPGVDAERYGRPSYLSPKLVSEVLASLASANGPANPSSLEADLTEAVAAVDAAPAGTPDALKTDMAGRLANAKGVEKAAVSLRAGIEGVPGDGQEQLNDLLDDVLRTAESAKDVIDGFQQEIERWFDSSMDRVSGWYKRNLQFVLLGVGLVLAVALNADALFITRALYEDPDRRASAVAAAIELNEARENITAGVPQENLDDALDELAMQIRSDTEGLKTAGIPLGWDQRPEGETLENWWIRAAGWLLTAVAISFGAPFWFDLMSKLVSIRSSGTKPATPPPPPPST